MPFVETLESYSRALYLPLRAYVRRPFQFVTETIRVHFPATAIVPQTAASASAAGIIGLAAIPATPQSSSGMVWDIRKAFEQTLLGTSRLTSSVSMDGMDVGALGRKSGGVGIDSAASLAASLGANGISGSGAGAGSGAAASGVNLGLGGFVGGYGSGSRALHTPSAIGFFTSSYFLLLFFMSIIVNRINAIVAPRNPHPLKLSVRFALKIPAFYLLIKSILVMAALLTQDQTSVPLAWMLSGIRARYTESHALWLSFIAMGVSSTIDSFIANLHSVGSNEQTINLLEWAIMFHFTPSGRDILIIAIIHTCQLLSLQILSLSAQGRDYRLVVTTFWGLTDLSHFTYAAFYRSTSYPFLQQLTHLPEVVVIFMVAISLCLHALTYVVTGGSVRRPLFESRAMPTLDEEYGLAVFKVGRACMEATRGIGFRNEVDAVVLPFGTILDKKRAENAFHSSSHASISGDRPRRSWSRLQDPSRGNQEVLAGFSNEVPDAVDAPGQRQQISRRRHRFNVIKEFCQSSASLFLDLALACYNKVVPARFRRTRITVAPQLTIIGNRMFVEEYIQLRTTVEHNLERARSLRNQKKKALEKLRLRELKEMNALDEEEERTIYEEFLSTDLVSSDDDEKDMDYVDLSEDEEPREDEDQDGDEMEDSRQDNSEEDTEFPETFGIRRRSHWGTDKEDTSDVPEEEAASDQLAPSWMSLGAFQDFFLDTSFMSIFLSSRLQDTPLTRSQHRLLMTGAKEFTLPEDEIEDEKDVETSQSDGGAVGSSGGDHSSKQVSRRKSWTSRLSRPSNNLDSRALLAVLKRHRKVPLPPPSPLPVYNETLADDGSGSMAPPPMTPRTNQASTEDSSMYSRLLCVVCQSEPRGIMLRPCRCLALCNECREVLASRRFKQCPCCRSDVQGFSKIYIP
ncbi:hypothetical protein BGW38_001725 [Lunasporangiospora selenospora]|uniref:RING-type domain-containing protein n=1 Tax=Lunasporangiospora selenospora TaxID=979761 RepID=A0A9P6FTL1_9FUNG|nr:hypothetical protein BGW38_001725 [Lunasporangiospora selenospora]